jgi:hypothetical protein
MSDIKWYNSIAVANALTTELNSLANAAAALSSAIDADADLAPFGDFELVATFGVAPTANSTVDCYLVRQVDGTNYEDASTTGPILPANGYVGSFVLRAVTTEQRIVLHSVTLPILDFKVLVVNNSGQSMAAANNTVKIKRYRKQVV